MKVCFDATLEDFVDVHKRSSSSKLKIVLYGAFVSLMIGGLLSFTLYLIFHDWLVTVMIGTVTVAVTTVTMISLPERNIRDFFKNRIKISSPTPCEIEVSEAGLTTRALGQTIIQEWKLIENIEETGDAIYFRNIFGLYTAARKRGFASDAEMKEFLDLVKKYWSEAMIPKPPVFK